MSEDFKIVKSSENPAVENQAGNKENAGGKVIDEANYKIKGPREHGPTAVGRGGDPLFRRISATREQLLELMQETQTVQDWVQRETCNNVAIACLEDENLKEDYFAIKDGFVGANGSYGKIALMGFKTPTGVEIPRLKVYDTNGEVLEVLTGPMAIDEIRTRVIAYKNSVNRYESVPLENNEHVESEVIAEYTGNPDDYTT
jgi:hypothetical protein